MQSKYGYLQQQLAYCTIIDTIYHYVTENKKGTQPWRYYIGQTQNANDHCITNITHVFDYFAR